jgi:tetratricopeptide (TPR) repeat protein
LQFGLADIDIARGKFDAAQSKAKAITTGYPDWYGGFRLLAKLMLIQKRFQESIQFGLEANKREPEAGVFIGLAIAYYQIDKPKESVDAVYNAIKLDKGVLKNPAGINEAVYSLADLKRDDDARSLAKLRMEADPRWRDDPTFIRVARHLRLVQ